MVSICLLGLNILILSTKNYNYFEERIKKWLGLPEEAFLEAIASLVVTFSLTHSLTH